MNQPQPYFGRQRIDDLGPDSYIPIKNPQKCMCLMYTL
jgi:hypothetical protein